jgi:hypothetical protein
MSCFYTGSTKSLNYRVFTFLFLLFASVTTHSQCIAVSSSGNIFNSTDNSNGGNVQFTNPQYASVVDGGKAVASDVLNLNASTQTYYLKATDFNFNIPTDAIICGVTVSVRKKASAGIINSLAATISSTLDYSIKDYDVRLIKGGITASNNRASTAEWPRSDGYEPNGGSSDLWGTTLTPTDVNSINFGVAISAVFTVNDITLTGLGSQLVSVGTLAVNLMAEIDAIQMTVYYSTPIVLPITLHSFDARIVNKTVQLNWSLAEQEEHGSVTVQRSLNKSPWQDIYQQSLQNSSTLHSYQLNDELKESGSYSYRLKLTTATGKVTFSPVRTINFKSNSSISIYPIPAQSWLNITSIETIREISVTNLWQQKVDVTVKQLTDHSIQLNVGRLPAGLYFVRTGNNVERFIKQ